MLQGILVCANYWSKWGHWERCEGVCWYGSSFTLMEEDRFRIWVSINDGSEVVLVNVKEEAWVTCARDGDYLMTWFNAENVIFWNIQGRALEPGNRRDTLFDGCIQRATLDAVWSKEDTTVKGTHTSIRAAILKAQIIEGNKIFLVLTPCLQMVWMVLHGTSCSSAVTQDVGSRNQRGASTV